MGIFKRIVHAATKDWKNANAQWKSVLKIEKIEKGEKVLPPKHPREVEPFEAAVKDPKLKELVDKKDEKLIDNVNKIKIESTDPPERWTSTKDLPTRETEWEHRNDPTWQYGFYEPPIEKMEQNRLMFREALDVLRYRMEFELPGVEGKTRAFADNAREKYQSHPAVGRIDPDKLERIWQYFRPFERSDTQRVVRKSDLRLLAEHIESGGRDRYPEHQPLIDALMEQKELAKPSSKKAFAKKFLQMKDEEREEFIKLVKANQQAQKDRLDKRLEEMKLLDSELQKQADEKESKEEKANQEKKAN